jgi:hypothetical protein
MLHQHTVVIASPERRQITEVSPQPTPRMRGGEIAQAGSQGKVVFGVEDMQNHKSGAKVVIFWHEKHEFTRKKIINQKKSPHSCL